MLEPIAVNGMTEDVATTSAAGAGWLSSPVQPTPGEMEAFAYQLEYGKVNRTDAVEQIGIEHMQASSVKMTEELLNAMPPEGARMSPEQLLQAQQKIQHAVHVVDLSAKVIGSVSQSINKLLSMQ